MSKKSITQRSQKKELLNKLFIKKINELKSLLKKDPLNFDLLKKFNKKIPKNSLSVRIVRRCEICGRSKAVLRRFKLCRICFRKFVMSGFIPGIQKSSW